MDNTGNQFPSLRINESNSANMFEINNQTLIERNTSSVDAVEQLYKAALIFNPNYTEIDSSLEKDKQAILIKNALIYSLYGGTDANDEDANARMWRDLDITDLFVQINNKGININQILYYLTTWLNPPERWDDSEPYLANNRLAIGRLLFHLARTFDGMLDSDPENTFKIYKEVATVKANVIPRVNQKVKFIQKFDATRNVKESTKGTGDQVIIGRVQNFSLVNRTLTIEFGKYKDIIEVSFQDFFDRGFILEDLDIEVRESVIQESLNNLSKLTKPREYSKEQSAELERDAALVTDGFNALVENIINGELIDPKFAELLSELLLIDDISVIQAKLLELWGSFTYSHKDSGEIAKTELQKTMADEDLSEFREKLTQIISSIRELLNPEGSRSIINPDSEMFDAKDSKSNLSSVLSAIGYIYFNLIKQKITENGKYENTRRKVAAALMFYETDSDKEIEIRLRDAIAYSLTGHIGVGKSVVEGLGIPMHGSGTTAISGAAFSQFHKVFKGIMKSWDPMRNKGYPIYPLMEILFEVGSLGFRKYYDDKYGQDLGILMDGYPRTVGQLEFFTQFATEFGITNIEELFKLVFMKFNCVDILDPGEEILELIIERVILSRTFDGLGVSGARNDHFKEILVDGLTGGVKELEREVVQIITEAIDLIGPKREGWEYKREVVLKALELFKVKFDISKIRLNPNGRLKSYDNGMNALARELEDTESPVRPIEIIVDRATGRDEIKTRFVEATFGQEMLETVEKKNQEA